MPGYELIGEEELNESIDVFNKGGILFRQGFENLRNNTYKVDEFERAFTNKLKTNYSLAVTSGTAALRVALAALDIKEGDEIITQSFTFVATVEAIIESKATPICANIDKTLNLDPNDLEKLINKNTKAIIVVHMLGTPANLIEIKKICDRHKIVLIEDTAWGCGGFLNEKALGTWGDIGTFSFDFAKTITTGEGGMVISDNKIIYEKAKAWHDHGHENNPNLPRWEDSRSNSGFNFRMMELQGAVGLAQLKKLDFIVQSQRKNKEYLWSAIKDIKGIEARSKPAGSYETADALVFFVNSKELAKRCRENLLENGLSTKILPEAFTWHFAGTWAHMKELVESHKNSLQADLMPSYELLSRAVAIPITVKDQSDLASPLRKSIIKVMN
tara:strand:- start:733 stop:1893 length:1161 start_codon:yes stop_codon:yes gene_type:complete